MASTPTASAIIAPLANAGKGAFHQAVRGPAASGQVPSYFSPMPVGQILQGGIIGSAYSETISAQGGASPYSFSISSGSLPAGLLLNGSTGVISGTPTTAATSTFTIQVTDANGTTGSFSFSITIAAPSSGAAANYCMVNG